MFSHDNLNKTPAAPILSACRNAEDGDSYMCHKNDDCIIFRSSNLPLSKQNFAVPVFSKKTLIKIHYSGSELICTFTNISNGKRLMLKFSIIFKAQKPGSIDHSVLFEKGTRPLSELKSYNNEPSGNFKGNSNAIFQDLANKLKFSPQMAFFIVCFFCIFIYVQVFLLKDLK